jgi:hypothetical protein
LITTLLLLSQKLVAYVVESRGLPVSSDKEAWQATLDAAISPQRLA